MAFGYTFTLALRSDGMIVAFGTGAPQLLTVPALPLGTTYLMCTAGQSHSVALRSDNVLMAWGYNWEGQLNVPTLPAGVPCVDIDAGQLHTVALLADGTVYTWGHESLFEAGIPQLTLSQKARGVRHVDVSVGAYNGVVVFSDGTATSFGDSNQVAMPALPSHVRYVRAEAEGNHSVALRTDGQLVAWGDNSVGQGAIPVLPPGMTYVDFAVGHGHTVAIRSDGQAFAFGSNVFAQCNIPPLPPGMSYVGVDAVYGKSMLLRSDGQVVLASTLQSGGLPAPALPPGVRYVSVAAGDTTNAALRSDGQGIEWGVGTQSGWVPVPPLPFGVSYVEVVAGASVAAWRRSDGHVVMSQFVGGGYSWLSLVPALEPGTSYLQLFSTYENTAARVGPTSTYVSIAHGCAGSQQPARLIPRDTPRIGKTLRVTLFDLPANVAMLAMGFTQLGPVSLGSLGMPGCDWNVALDGTALLVGQGGQATWGLPIPDLPSLVGIKFFNQALVLDPAAGNPFGAVVSDIAEGVVGYP